MRGIVLYGFDGFRADAAAGKIDDADQRLVIERVCHKPQIRQHIFDFLAVVEFKAAEYFERNRVRRKFLFERAGERVYAHEHGEIGIGVPLADELADGASDEHAFVAFLFRLVYLYLFALFLIRPQSFLFAPAVVFDGFVRHGENVFRGAVIALQFEYLRRRKLLFELQNVFYPRAAPAVDGLIVVADGEQVAVHGGKQPHDFELHFVGILKFVHHDVAEFAAEAFARFFIGAKQAQSAT